MFTSKADVIDSFLEAVRLKKVKIYHKEDTDYRSDWKQLWQLSNENQEDWPLSSYKEKHIKNGRKLVRIVDKVLEMTVLERMTTIASRRTVVSILEGVTIPSTRMSITKQTKTVYWHYILMTSASSYYKTTKGL